MQSIHFLVNGNLYYVNKETNLLKIIKYFNYSESLLVVEYNRLICNKTEWNKIIIKDHDRIELVTIVGGG